MGVIWPRARSRGKSNSLMGNIRTRLPVLLFSLFAMLHGAPLWAEPDWNSCISCHSHDNMTLPVGIKSMDKCASCHDDMPLLLAATEKVKPGVSPHEISQLPPMGMSLPLYADSSRLGSEPNKMVLVPAGEFIMGTNERLPDEGPEYKVTLPDYYIDLFEVTNLQYKKFIDATKRKSPTHFKNRTFPKGKADHPVTFVTWFDADAYCKWASKRLPTDQEWEKAARGSDGRWFPWGNEFALDRANTPLRWAELNAFGDTSQVGAFESGRSPYGLYDMSGNVWEWTASWYQAYPGNKTASESYGERYKVLKGGSWWDCSFYSCGISAPVFNRSFFASKTRNDTFGFRCARDKQ